MKRNQEEEKGDILFPGKYNDKLKNRFPLKNGNLTTKDKSI